MQKVVVGQIGVDRLDADVAKFGHARQRLALPAPVAMLEHIDPASHIIELGNHHKMASGREARERLSLARLEEHVKSRGSLPEKFSRSVAISAPAG